MATNTKSSAGSDTGFSARADAPFAVLPEPAVMDVGDDGAVRLAEVLPFGFGLGALAGVTVDDMRAAADAGSETPASAPRPKPNGSSTGSSASR